VLTPARVAGWAVRQSDRRQVLGSEHSTTCRFLPQPCLNHLHCLLTPPIAVHAALRTRLLGQPSCPAMLCRLRRSYVTNME